MGKSLGKKFLENWKSGLAVALVSLPAAVTLSVAAHAHPTAGIVTAIWAGFIASLFASSNYNIVSPTASLAGVLAAYALRFGVDKLPSIAILAGCFILIAYALKLEHYIDFVPMSTIHGIILGIAGTVLFNQINAAFGLTGTIRYEKCLDNLLESFSHLATFSWPTVLIFLFFLSLLFLCNKIIPRIPGSIVIAPLGIIIGILSSNGFLPISLALLGTKFKDIDPQIFIQSSYYFSPSLLFPSFTVAFIAIIETLISARIADNITKTKHNRSRELLGLGLANIMSGLVGGIPATASLARTALNIKAGCTHRFSATLSSIFVGLISLLFLNFFKYIPLAVVAAILVFISIKMVEKKHFVKMFFLDKKAFFIACLVAIVTFLEDPIMGVIAGAGITLLILLKQITIPYFTQEYLTPTSSQEDQLVASHHILVHAIKGPLIYCNAHKHLALFTDYPIYATYVILDCAHVIFADLDGIEALNEIISAIQSQGKQVIICGINQQIEQFISKESSLFRSLKQQGFVVASLKDAHAHHIVSPKNISHTTSSF